MSFSSITDEQIAAGEPTAQPLFQKIKDDLDDHESRLADAEAGLASLAPIAFEVFGKLDTSIVADELLIYRIVQNLTLTGCRLLIATAGSSGTLTVDVEYKRGAGAWTTILSSPISGTSAEGNYNLKTGTLAVVDLLAGDLLRLNIDACQTDMRNFGVYVENTAAA